MEQRSRGRERTERIKGYASITIYRSIVILTYRASMATIDATMQTVKVSPKFQVVIPKQLRERLKLRPGQDLFIYEIDGQIRLALPDKAKNLRGLVPGIRWEESDRDRDERI